jgi:hypothetical protein
MTEDEFAMTNELKRRAKERDQVLMRFDCTAPAVLEAELQKRGFKTREEFRKAIEHSYWVHENPYDKPNFSKKEYKVLEDMTLDKIISNTELRKTKKKFKDPEIGTAMIEGDEIVKIKGKKRGLTQ